MFKSKVDEAAYVGNIGMMELMKFHQKANAEQKRKLQQHIKNKEGSKAWQHIQSVTNVKLHKSVNEEIKSFIQYCREDRMEEYAKYSYHKVHVEKDGKKTSFLGRYIGSTKVKDVTVHKFDEVDMEGVSRGREQWVQSNLIKKTIPHSMDLKYGMLKKK